MDRFLERDQDRVLSGLPPRPVKEESYFAEGGKCMHRFIKLGLSLGSVFCLLTGPTWAQEDSSESTITSKSTGRGSAVAEWNIDTFAANPVSSFRGVSQGTDNVFGSLTCNSAGTSQYIGPAEPPAADVEGGV